MPGRKSGPTPQQLAVAKVYSLPPGWSRQTLDDIPTTCRLDDETIGVLKVAMAAGELNRAQINVFKLSFTQECKVRAKARGVGKPFLDMRGRAITEDLKPLKGESTAMASKYSCQTILHDGDFRKQWVSWGFPDPVHIHTEPEDYSDGLIAETCVMQLKDTIAKALDDLEALALLRPQLNLEVEIPQFLREARREFRYRFIDEDDIPLVPAAKGKAKEYETNVHTPESRPRKDQDATEEVPDRLDNIPRLRRTTQRHITITSDEDEDEEEEEIPVKEEESKLPSSPITPSLGENNHSRTRSFDLTSTTRPRRNTGSYQREKNHRRTVSAVMQAFCSNNTMPQTPDRRPSMTEHQSYTIADVPRRTRTSSRAQDPEQSDAQDKKWMKYR